MIRTLLIILFLSSTSWLFGQTLKAFQYSDCIENNMSESSNIQISIEKLGIKSIQLRTFAPCGGQFKGGFELSSSRILDLRFTVIPEMIKGQNAQPTDLLEIAECNCFFEFTYDFEGLPDIEPISIKVNGKSLFEIDRLNFADEIIFDQDTIR